MLAINAKFKVSQEDSILMLSALNFDLAIYDIFGILGVGGALCIPTLQEDRSPRHWLKLLVENHITIWNSVPALMQIMLDYLSRVSLDENEKKGLESLRLILLSGDWISITLPPLIQTYFPNAKIISLGGATEASIWSNFFEINKVQSFWKRIPYGKALPNQSLLIMDSNLELCQPGVLGTLYIGGEGLAEGYLDPIQTSKQFINHPVNQERFYNTGDLARVSFDGIVDFLGRIDSQVKINGYRIELEEVESALLKCKEVSYAAVNIKKGARGFYLCAYLVKHKNSIVKKERLLEHLTACLPYYMIPTEYFLIEKLPLNKNGKLDRGRLDIEVVQKISSNKHEEAFVFHEEIILREIWSTILKLNKDEFGVTDNFFELGGDSISAIQIASHAINYGFEFTNRDIFEFPTIQSLAKKLLKKSSENSISSECAIDSCKPLLSSLQRGILYETEKSNLKDIYLVQVTFNITKAINLDKLKKVVELILNKHDIFRLQFYGLEPILKKGELSVAWEVHENFSGDREMVSNILDAERKKEFSLKNAPLLKFKIFKNKKSIEFLITYHHIILDGWSLSNFLIETFSLYAGKNITTEKNEFAYFVSYMEKLKVVENNGFKKYWEKVFNGFNFESLNVKTSREAQRKDFNFLSFNFTSELYERIKVVCRNMSITQNSFFSTAFGLALRFYKNSDDFIFGTIISGRDVNLKAIDKRMGMFINTIPVRFKYSTDKRLFEILKNMQSQLLESRKYGYSSLIEIGEALNHPMGNLPFFDALFIFDSYPREAITTINAISNNVKIEQFKVHEFINYPFVFSMDIDENQNVSVRTCFLDLFFSKKQIDCFYSTFISICEKMLFFNDSVTDIKIHQKESSEIEKFEKGKVKKRSELLLKDIISDVSEKFENNISVIYNEKHLTYRELLKKTEEVASFLSSEYKLKLGDVVALHVKKSIQYIVFLLALIKQGFIYLPINFNYPLDRAKKILSNSHARLLITDHEDFDNILGLKQIKVTASRSVYLDSEKARKNYVDRSIKNDETLYLIFTSGSTGEPKGVEIKNESLVNMLLFFKEKLNFLPSQSMFFLSSISFDISLLEVFLPLISGGVIHILDDEITTSPETLVKYINNNTIHYIQATPSMWEMLIAAGLKNKKETTVLCGGEALSEHTKNKLIQISSRIFQVYGPTETTVWSTLSILSKKISSSVIGYPISNTCCYVLSDSFQRLPFGVIGELYIAGQGLALGYLNSKENIDKFLLVKIDGVFHKLYKTGDLVKRLDNGALEFFGRNDSQVKIRGYRVETKEVETVIKKYGGIENCIVNLVNHDHHQFLVAYLRNDSGFYKDKKQEGMDYSLFFFSANSTQGGDKYSLLVNSVIYADQNKFDAVWLPERHFDIVGGNYSSPSVISAYLASITKRLKLRAGSLILPLHNVFRAAEEWSIVDNLSNGRIGISFGSGWHPNDFVLSATNYLDRKNILASGIEKFIMLWSGEKLTAKNGLQQDTDVEIFPKPIQEKLPVWISISKNQEGYIYAGENNFNILTHTLEQDLEQLEKNISLYRSRLKDKKGHVTLMLHTFLDDDNEFAIKTAKEALSSYFKCHLNLLERINNLESCELNGSSPDLIDSYIDSAFSYYMKEGALIGSPKECMSKVQKLMDMGVDEIACFIDFGVDEALVFKSLPFIAELMDKTKYIRRTPNVDIEQLKKYLETRLPVYMLPSHFLTLSKVPLTPNGKTDARALEKLFLSNHIFTLNNELEAKEINSENFVIEQMKSIWKDLLSLHSVSENENFFSLGGHSLLAMQMLTKIHDIFNKKILLSQFIVEPTISNIGKYIVECKTEDSLKIYKSQDVKYIPLSFPQQRIWYNHVLLENEPIYPKRLRVRF